MVALLRYYQVIFEPALLDNQFELGTFFSIPSPILNSKLPENFEESCCERREAHEIIVTIHKTLGFCGFLTIFLEKQEEQSHFASISQLIIQMLEHVPL